MQTVWRLSELLSVTGGELIGSAAEDQAFGGIVYPLEFVTKGRILVHCSTPDWPSRQARLSHQDRYDLEKLLEFAGKRSASLVITSAIPPTSPPLTVLRVADSHRAFFQLARHARSRFRGRVISVTGTVGKSTTTDILGRFLSQVGTTVKSFGNWNSVEGSGMCLTCLPADADFCVIEQSEESILGQRGYSSADTVRPDDLIVTTLGFGKIRKFASVEVLAEVVSHQIRSLPEGGNLYFPPNVTCREMLESAVEHAAIHVPTEESGSGLEAWLLENSFDGSRIGLSSEREYLEVQTPIVGGGWIENIRLAALCARQYGVALNQIASEIQSMTPPPRKMEVTNPVIAGIKVTLLDDSHNAEVGSFENALSFFGGAARGFDRRIVIAGKIVEIEGGEEYAYGVVAQSIRACEPFAVILFGDGLDRLGRALGDDTPLLRAPTPDDVLALMDTLVDGNTAILLKGSSRDTRIKELSKLLKSGPRETSAATAGPAGDPGDDIREGLSNPKELEISLSGDFSVGIVGDTYFGEYYAERALASRRPHPLLDGDYEGCISAFRSLLSSNALNIANLETPLTELASSPYLKDRPYPHRADSQKTLQALNRAEIDAVTLGNNHLFDYGRQGIVDTLSIVDSSPLTAVGAGMDAGDAARPLLFWADQNDAHAGVPAGRNVLVYSGFAYRRSMEERFGAYARQDQPGCHPINRQSIAAIAAARERFPDALIIVVPHWQRDYLWASKRQRNFARDALAAGADLLIGHGAHMLQQVERFGGRLAVHGIGNFIFQSPGRTRQSFAQPIGAAARLMIPADPARPTYLRLYPIFTDNRASGYRTHLLRDEEFDKYMSRYVRLGFLPADAALKRDDIGRYVELALTVDP